MPTRIIDINDPNIQFPEFIILDASIVLWLHSNPRSLSSNFSVALNFLNQLQPLAFRGEVMPLLPLLAYEECIFKICEFEVKAHLNNVGASDYWHNYYKNHPKVLLHSQRQIENFHQVLQAFPIVVTEPEDLAIHPIDTESRLADRMVEMMYRFLVLPKDATILSEAERLGVETVATLDSDWTRADSFTVITNIN